MSKQGRHFSIREIVASGNVHSQEALRKALQKRGFRVTQATLSRDMKELGVARIATESGLRYGLQPPSEATILKPLVGQEVISIGANEAVVVVRTLPGCANTVGEYVDLLSHPEILGTVAGDNTLLVIPSSAKKTQLVLHILRNKLIEGA